MKKRVLVITTLALTFALSSGVFARGNYGIRNNGYSMMNGNYNSTRMSDGDYSKMNEFMEENFGYSMMNRGNYSGRMSDEDYNKMNEFMEENFGYSMMDGSRGYGFCH